jgi:hypothetical protein
MILEVKIHLGIKYFIFLSICFQNSIFVYNKKNTMRRLLTLLMLVPFLASAEIKTILLADSSKCQYETKAGMLDGEYKSFYKNGKLKCEGSFLQNNRFGFWVFYKTDGSIQCIRDYQNNYSFEEKTASKQVNQVKANQNNTWTPIYEKDIIFKKRNITTLTSTENAKLFESENLMQNLMEIASLNSKNIFMDSRFTVQADKEIFSNASIVGLRLKEDLILDQAGKCLQYRIIGMAPLIRSEDGSSLKELCWIYYPSIKADLQKIAMHQTTPLCKTLGDIFEFRCFAGSSVPLLMENVEIAQSVNQCIINTIENENSLVINNFSSK